MRIKGLVILILFMIFIHGQVLPQKNPSFVGINAGLSIPYADFKATNLGTGSFAMTGFTGSIEGAWFFKPRFGVGASTGISFNPVDVYTLGWEKVKADKFLNDVTIRSDPYLTITAMAGFYTQIPVFKNISFNGKLLGGLLYGQTPYQLYKPEYFIVGPSYYEITSAKDWKFSWQAGAGFQYDVSSCVAVVLEGSIQYDKLSFNFLTSSGTRTDIHTIAIINTTLGVRIKI